MKYCSNYNCKLNNSPIDKNIIFLQSFCSKKCRTVVLNDHKKELKEVIKWMKDKKTTIKLIEKFSITK